ncbi:MAG: right-handed parallel beta-helix repeat-containing protein [Myxococcales bacterium]|nr:right-handed parallel beta-helix repeat-containing protein [Myxococcales bacterium]
MAMACEHCGRRYPTGGVVCRHDGQLLVPDPRVGQTVADHRIVGLLRPHPVGAVYRVEGPDGVGRALVWYDRSVAPDEVEADFVEALQALAKLRRNRHLPTVLAAGKVGEDPYVIYAPVEAPSLGSARRWSPGRVAALGSALARALADAAAAGVHHGALRPSCIYLLEGDRPRVEDFLVRQLGEVEDDDHPPWAYAAPEDDPGHPSEAGDVYALGVMLYTLAAGENPFRALFDPAASRERHKTRVAPALAARLGAPAAALSHWVERMLAKAPGDRPTLSEVATGLMMGLAPELAPMTSPLLPEPEPEWVEAPEPEPEPVPEPEAEAEPEPEPDIAPEPEAEPAPAPEPAPHPAPPAPAMLVPTPEVAAAPASGPTEAADPGGARAVRILLLAGVLVALVVAGLTVAGYLLFAGDDSPPLDEHKAAEPDAPVTAEGPVTAAPDGGLRPAPGAPAVLPGESLAAAIAATAPGGTVRLAPGVHPARLSLSRSVVLAAADPEQPARIEGEGTVLAVGGGTVTLRGVQLHQTGGEGDAVHVRAGHLVAEAAQIQAAVGNGIRVDGAARLTVRGGRIGPTKKSAVYALGEARVEVERLRTEATEHAAFEVAGDARVSLRALTLMGGEGAGVFASDRAHVVLEDSELTGFRLAAVEIAEEATAEITRNRLHHGRASGGFVRGASPEVRFVANTITHNKLAGVELKQDARAQLVGNTLTDGLGSGIYVHSGAAPVLSHNTLSRNALAGLELKGSGRAVVSGNHFEGNGGSGIYAHAQARAVAVGNTVTKHSKAGVKAGAGTRLELIDNVVEANGEAGIFLFEGAQGLLLGNLIRRNAFAGLEVRERADPEVRGNVIEANKGSGIYVHHAGRGRYVGNRLVENGGTPFRQVDAQVIQDENNGPTVQP